jgi:hypothetical protein
MVETISKAVNFTPDCSPPRHRAPQAAAGTVPAAASSRRFSANAFCPHPGAVADDRERRRPAFSGGVAARYRARLSDHALPVVRASNKCGEALPITWHSVRAGGSPHRCFAESQRRHSAHPYVAVQSRPREMMAIAIAIVDRLRHVHMVMTTGLHPTHQPQWGKRVRPLLTTATRCARRPARTAPPASMRMRPDRRRQTFWRGP